MIRILLIEDETAVRENVLEMLDAAGYEPIEADNGATGVELAKSQRPDLILCDVMMPQLDGHSVLSQLANDPKTSAIPFIFLTAKATRQDIREGMKLGADDYLTKPFTMAELIEAIEARLQKRNVVQEQLDRTERQLNYLLYHDSLTNLPNHLALQDRFSEIVALLESNSPDEASSDSAQFVPVFHLSLDRFDRVEETLTTHEINVLIKAVAVRLTNCANGTVARSSDSKFTIIGNPVSQKRSAAETARSLLQVIARPINIGDRPIFLTASIGIALYPRDDRDLSQLLKQAKKASDRAQQRGGSQYEFYTAAYNIGAVDFVSMESDLRRALELDSDELQVFYQPQIDLKTDNIVAAEALARWYRQGRSFVPPNQFIPIAEETGAIEPLGSWVMGTACQHLKQLHLQGWDSLRVAVNLSSRQFDNLELRQRTIEFLSDANLNPNDLELELTETCLVRDMYGAQRQLSALRTIGFTVAIDDFGTGYSSLSYLQQFPFDVLKIDRAFISSVDKNEKNAAIVRAVLDMARQMRLKSVAEGVETAQELEFLKRHGCDVAQGYYIARPMPFVEFEKLLRSTSKLPI